MKRPKYDYIPRRLKIKYSTGLSRDGYKLSHKMVKDSLDAEFGPSDEDVKYNPRQIIYESIQTY